MTWMLELPEEGKRCTVCKTWKIYELFGVNNRTKDGKRSECKTCRKEYTSRPEVRKEVSNKNREKFYNLTPSMFSELKLMQGNKCASCKEPFADGSPCVDHDHKTLYLRGLLCNRCNLALGGFGDNIEGVKNMYDFLLRHQQHVEQCERAGIIPHMVADLPINRR